jgi:hypothetical protein
MNESEETFEERAERRRRTWTGRIGTSHVPMQASETTVEQRVSFMSVLSESVWAMTGRPMPEYTRDRMPGRLIRNGRS